MRSILLCFTLLLPSTVSPLADTTIPLIAVASVSSATLLAKHLYNSHQQNRTLRKQIKKMLNHCTQTRSTFTPETLDQIVVRNESDDEKIDKSLTMLIIVTSLLFGLPIVTLISSKIFRRSKKIQPEPGEKYIKKVTLRSAGSTPRSARSSKAFDSPPEDVNPYHNKMHDCDSCRAAREVARLERMRTGDLSDRSDASSQSAHSRRSSSRHGDLSHRSNHSRGNRSQRSSRSNRSRHSGHNDQNQSALSYRRLAPLSLPGSPGQHAS